MYYSRNAENVNTQNEKFNYIFEFFYGDLERTRLHFSVEDKIKEKRAIPNGIALFGDLERTRTVDLQRDRLAC